uniref:N-acetylated-alpha-linked acidic dipeptidase 2 n=1 Tax=Panagrellus redivivus TaxID=6233 RepID=A0A7E4VXM3_PANRE
MRNLQFLIICAFILFVFGIDFDPNRAKTQSVLINNIDGLKIKETLKTITAYPHVAGTPQNARVADTIANLWKRAGLEDVHFKEYEALLSYSDNDRPNHVSIIDKATGKTFFKTIGMSPVIIPYEQSTPRANIQWLAYSGDGTAIGEPVYANYGREEDFEKLKEIGISVKDKIVVIRYGRCYRGNKVKLAQKYGAKAVILYSDPAEVAQHGTHPSNTYPNSEWMPSGGVQRGSLKVSSGGDILTPLVPAIKDGYPTLTIEEAYEKQIIPRIPVIPLSYGDAYHILSRLSGNETVDYDAQGGFNFTYRYGPGFNDSNSVIKVEVNSKLETKTIRNIVGYIKGAVEPDQYVILGNHYDAWVYGSIDPGSGTAVLAEVARAFVKTMQQTNWRPARTIMFCAWDAEEHGLIGSTEFVEEFEKQLSERAVVYLNVDNIKSNGSFSAETIPSMFAQVVETAKVIRNPVEDEIRAGRTTVYDTWFKTFSTKFTPCHPDYPEMAIPAASSDMAGFLNYIGIPVINFTYRNASWTQYPLYHSLYETIFAQEHIFDTNDFAIHRSIGQFWAELARSYADKTVIPLNVTIFADQLKYNYLAELRGVVYDLALKHSELVDSANQLKILSDLSDRLLNRSRIIDNQVQNDISVAKWYSNRVFKVERCFINPNMSPEQPQNRHLLYSISDKNNYAAATMSHVYDVVSEIENATDVNTRKDGPGQLGVKLARAIALVQYGVNCVINQFDDVI